MFILHAFESQKTSTWSGGTTTELYIFPKNTNYLERNFDFRISTATVETEESDFSDLKGFNRALTILEGNLQIIHETVDDNNKVNQYSKKLNTFETHYFDGSWKTKSIGKVRDFNVIFEPNLNVEVDLKSLSNIVIQKQNKFHFLLLLDNCSIEKMAFKKYDLIEIEDFLELDFLEKINFLEIRID
ncbi:MAG: HutD family protein [Flavobacteriia bacterium]|jgi:environmental stress-induced protein Ves